MNKKVLVLANNSDGLYRFRHELLEELKKQYSITVSTPFDNFIPELELICNKLIRTEFDRRGTNPIRDLRLLFSYAHIVGGIKPDLVIAYTIKPNIYGGIISRIARRSYVVNVTGLGTAFENDGIVQKMVLLLYRFALGKAKFILFENSADREVFVRKTKVPYCKTYVLHGAGVNIETYAYQAFPDNDTTRFLFIGRVMKEKGIEELLEASHRLILNGYKCFVDIVGPCEEDYSSLLDQYEEEGWMKYYGFQPDVRPFIKRADCFVLPSYHEGMANTNLECAASGRPIITSDIPGCREAVIEGKTGFLCKPKDAESLYRAMTSMLALPSKEREAMGKAGREHIKDQFDKRVIVAQTMKLIGEV